MRDCDHPARTARSTVSRNSEATSVSIGFSTTDKFISKVIRFVTRGKMSHAWIAFDDATLGVRLVVQAEAWGYEVRPWARWLQENRLVAEFRPNRALEQELPRLAVDLGSKYDWTSAVFAGLRRWFGRWVKARLIRSPSRLMCSEAVVRFLSRAGFAEISALDPELTSPAALHRVIKASPNFTRIRTTT